jgi:hypothetical protein
VLLLRTLRVPWLGAPGQLIAGGAGALPDHPISGTFHTFVTAIFRLQLGLESAEQPVARLFVIACE